MKKRYLFTLVELLVTIGIIAILSSMLLPALRKAKERSEKILCLSNQKQCGIGLLTYVSEFDGYIPKHDNMDGTNGRCWGDLLSYNGILSSEAVDHYVIKGLCAVSWLKNGSVLECPSLRPPRAVTHSGITFNSEPNTATTYGVRFISASYHYSNEQLGVGGMPKLNSIRRDIPYLGDSIRELATGEFAQSYLLGFCDVAWENTAGNINGVAHGSVCNAWFTDGHAEGLTREKLLNKGILPYP